MIYIFISHPWVWLHCWIFIAVSMHLVMIYWCGGGSSAERQKQGSFSETEFSDCTYEFCIHPAQYVENIILNNYRLYENELPCMKFSALVEQSQSSSCSTLMIFIATRHLLLISKYWSGRVGFKLIWSPIGHELRCWGGLLDGVNSYNNLLSTCCAGKWQWSYEAAEMPCLLPVRPTT